MRGHTVFWGVNDKGQVPHWIEWLTGPEVKVDCYRRAAYAATHFAGRSDENILNYCPSRFNVFLVYLIGDS